MVASVETAIYTPDDFITGDFPIVTEPETLITGQNLAARSVLGRITVSGKLTLSLTAAIDGSQVPVCILVDAADATAADKVVPVYKAGQFNPTALVYGAAHTAATVGAAFDGTPLFLRAPL